MLTCGRTVVIAASPLRIIGSLSLAQWWMMRVRIILYFMKTLVNPMLRVDLAKTMRVLLTLENCIGFVNESFVSKYLSVTPSV